MATIKGKPTGYFEKVLALDCETSGLAYNSDDPSIDVETGKMFQSVSWGFIVADAQTLKPIEKMYLEIQWDGKSEWSSGAEKVHGLSKKHLKKNGFTEEEAVEAIGTLILKHWGPNVSIRLLGHNVLSFDIWFLKRLMRKHGIELKFGARHIDTNTVGFVNWETFTSDQLFEAIGMPERESHNALDDAMMSLESARITRVIFKKALEEE